MDFSIADIQTALTAIYTFLSDSRTLTMVGFVVLNQVLKSTRHVSNDWIPLILAILGAVVGPFMFAGPEPTIQKSFFGLIFAAGPLFIDQIGLPILAKFKKPPTATDNQPKT